jgi:hypothetical protein
MTITGGEQDDAGTTIAQGGATFDDATFTLGGGRTLELQQGSSFATGGSDTFYLNVSPSDVATVMEIASGATFTDQTTGGGLYIAYYNYGPGAVDNLGTFVKSGSAALSTIDVAFNNSGVVNVESGTLELNGAFTNNGALNVDGGAAAVQGAATGVGSASVGEGGSLTFDAAVAAGQTISIADSTGILQLVDPADFAGVIANLAADDAIDLTNIAPSSIVSAGVYGSTIEIGEAGGATLTLNVSGALANNQIYVIADGDGGSDLVLSANPVASWNGVGGDWGVAANWLNGLVPTAATDVYFNQGGADTVTVTTTESANSLTVNALGVDILDEAGGRLTLHGSLTVNGGAFDMDGGYFYVDGAITIGAKGQFIGSGAVTGLINNGIVEANANFTFSGAVTGYGNYQIDNNVTIDFGGSVAGGSVTFGTNTGQLTIGDPTSFNAEIAGLSGSGDVIYLPGVPASGTSATTTDAYDAATGLTTLTVEEGGGPTFNFKLDGDYSTSTWTVNPGPNNLGVYITDPPASAAPATHAATIDVGAADEVLTAHGDDTFVFKPTMGNDAISGLHTERGSGSDDVVDVKAFHFASYQDLLTAMTDTPEGETINLGHHSLLLEGLHKSDLHADLFHL